MFYQGFLFSMTFKFVSTCKIPSQRVSGIGTALRLITLALEIFVLLLLLIVYYQPTQHNKESMDTAKTIK